jgi:hypothetical protein
MFPVKSTKRARAVSLESILDATDCIKPFPFEKYDRELRNNKSLIGDSVFYFSGKSLTSDIVEPTSTSFKPRRLPSGISRSTSVVRIVLNYL